MIEKVMTAPLMLLIAIGSLGFDGTFEEVNRKSWIHGSKDCSNNTDPAIDVYRYNDATFILRQNMCVNYEAPFVYVFFGEHTVFVQDTGATTDADLFPLYDTILSLIKGRQREHPTLGLKILVTHSHSHRDHTAGDSQFRDQPNVILIEPTREAMRAYFKFDDWPRGTATIDIGGRLLTVIPVPGHHDEAIAVYDASTKWLLTGDGLYPGRLYVKDWDEFKSSIRRLVTFSQTQEISAVMGTHIEMSKHPGRSYPLGSTHHPTEAGLALSVEDLLALDDALSEIGDQPRTKVMPKFTIRPLNAIEKFLGWAFGVLGIG